MKKKIYSIIISSVAGLALIVSSCAQSSETSQSQSSSKNIIESIIQNDTQSQLVISESVIQSSEIKESSIWEESSREEYSSEAYSSEEDSVEESWFDSYSEEDSVEESSFDCSLEESSSEEDSSVKEPVRHYPYQLGDDVEDFTIVLSDGSRLTLSEVLKNKKLVIIKFWATWCGPCVREWPALVEAYKGYEEDVLILCVSVTDSNAAVQSYKQENNLPFAFAEDALNLADEFGVRSIPYKFMIDENGVLAESHLGAVTSVDAYTALFDKYCQ
jgi:cytochrome c-type biogenesis protein